MKKKNSILKEVEIRHKKKQSIGFFQKKGQIVFYVMNFFLWFSFSFAEKNKREVYFATSNNHKLTIAQKIFEISINKKEFDISEIQGTQDEVIWDKLLKVASKLKNDGNVFLVEDTSIEFDGLEGFPGPYGKDFINLGIEKIIKIVGSLTRKGRVCHLVTIFGLAYKDSDDSMRLILFRGKVKGKFTLKKKDKIRRFDDAFVADEDQKSNITKVFRDVDIGRVKALKDLKKFLKDNILKS